MFEGEKVAPAVRESILGAVSVAKEAWNTVVKGDDLESLTVDAQLSEDSIAFLDNKSSAGGTSTIPTLESDFAKKVLGGTSSLFSFTSLSGKPLQPLIELPDPVSLEQDMEVTEEEEVDDSVLTEEKARSDILKMCISIAENIQRTNKVTLYPKIPSTLEEFEAKPKSYESVAVEVLGRFRMRKMIPDIKFKPGPKITKRLVQVKLGKQGQREQRAKQIEVMYSEHRARFEDRDPVRVEVGKFQATATQATATSKKDLQRYTCSQKPNKQRVGRKRKIKLNFVPVCQRSLRIKESGKEKLLQASGIEEAREQMEAKGLHCKKVIDEVLKVFGRHFLGSQIESSIEAKMNIFDARQKEATEEFTFPRSLSFLLTLLASLGHQDEATKIFKELNSKIRSSIKIEQLPEDDHVEAWNKLMEIGWTTPEKSEKEQLSFLEFKKLHDEIMARGEGWKAEVQRLMSESKQSVKEEKEASSETESKETEPSDVILTTVEKAEAAAGFTFAGIADLWKRFSRALVGESEFESGTESAATYIGNVISLLRSMGVPEAADAFYARLQPAFQKAKAVAQANETKTVRGWVPGIRTVKAAAMVLPPTQTVEPKTTAADKDYSKLLSFAIAQAIVDASQKSPTLSSSDFQLLCADQYLRRTEGLLDSRMEPLHLDDWQRKMLDVVDEGRSGLIVAPTSAGKSFISYYVVKKILEENPDATICFVVPTKALVNQIVVDTQTRLRILRQAGGRNPAGIFTQEMRTQELNSNILITVPECLEMCYLDTNRSDSWTPSVQYAVLDEVHNLHGRNGAIWERLLLFGSIPFLAMSATVGNAQEIYSWLRKARRDTDLAPVIDASDTAAGPSKNATTGNSESEKKDLEELGIDISLGDSDEEDLEMTIEDDESAGDADAKEEEKEAVKAETVEGKAEDREVKDANVVELIQHNIRWNDLIFHVWSPEKGLVPVSPLAGLTVEDIALGHQSLYSTRLTPRQAVVFYQVLMEATRELKMDSPKLEPLKLALEALYPPKWFGNRGVDMIKLSETYEYERNVKACLQYMARLEPGVVRAMLAKMHVGIQEAVAPLMKSVEDAESTEEFMKTYLLNYLFSMKNLNRFPIICFALDNNMLVTLAKQMATALRSMENDYKEKKYGENWRDIINKRIAETETAIANLETKFTSLPPSQRNNPHNEVNERLSEKRTELAYLRNSLTHMDEFCFGRLTEEEVATALFMKLYRSNRAAAVKKVKEPPMDEDMTLRAALLRGIGVHHEAMPYRYRAAVEDLFGGRRLAVVLATNTLAQGINMPCRTVTFLMDSPYLNGINFQQMSGRAGRRGFDYRGEVVFLALPERKLLRLITSPPPLLRGNSLLDATSLLRLQQSYSNAPSKAVKERLVEW
ncbi:DDX60L, partial [Symbiodinium sp. KB8]